MKAMFNTVKEFAVFNAKPHTFGYSAPYQVGASGKDQAVFVNMVNGSKEVFKSRVEQFGGVCLG